MRRQFSAAAAAMLLTGCGAYAMTHTGGAPITPRRSVSSAIAAAKAEPAPPAVELEGALEVTVVELGRPSARTGTRTDVVLIPDSAPSSRVELQGVKPAGLEHGKRVRVRGRARAALRRSADPSAPSLVIDVDTLEPLSLEMKARSAAPLVTQRRGIERALAMPVTFRGATEAWPSSGARSVEEIRELMFGAQGLRGFLEEQSSGLYSITGDVAPLATLDCDPTNCPYDAILSKAYAAAKAAGFDPASYNRHVVFFNPTAGNGWWGLGTVGGGDQSWSLVTWIYDLQVLAHEFGHNLTLSHSHSCEPGTGVNGVPCVNKEYGDVACVMGGSYGGYSVNQRRRIGWLDAPDVPSSSSSTSGHVALAPLTEPGLRSPRAVFLPGGYSVEYRRPIGFDAHRYPTSYDGAFIRVDNGDGVNFSLLDMTPETPPEDPVLRPGMTFAAGNTRVAISGARGNDLELDLGGGPSSPTPSPATPSPSATPTATRSPSAGITLAVQARQQRCGQLEVTVDATKNGRPIAATITTTIPGLLRKPLKRTTGRDGHLVHRIRLDCGAAPTIYAITVSAPDALPATVGITLR